MSLGRWTLTLGINGHDNDVVICNSGSVSYRSNGRQDNYEMKPIGNNGIFQTGRTPSSSDNRIASMEIHV